MTNPRPHRPDAASVDNPLRDEQRQHVRDELEARLRHRGASIDGSESEEEILSLSNAVEGFERAVMQSGGDLMVDSPASSRPDNPEYVLPQRRADESTGDYIGRIKEATEGIGRER